MLAMIVTKFVVGTVVMGVGSAVALTVKEKKHNKPLCNK